MGKLKSYQIQKIKRNNMTDLNDSFQPICFFDEGFVIPSDRQEYRAYKYTEIIPSNKPKRTLSKETREKISNARRKRKKQPREGQSKRSMSLYSELMEDYKKNKEAIKWIKEHKSEMDGSQYAFDENGEEVSNPGHVQAREIGITTAYTQMYADHYEYKLESVLFGDSVFEGHCEDPRGKMFEEVFGNEPDAIDDED